MRKIVIPLQSDIELTDDCIIDMSNTSFNISTDKEKLASLVYIRNCGIKNELDFSECSFEDKCEYLLTYMKNNVDVYSIQLIETWSAILTDGAYDYDSILDDVQLELFKDTNNEYIHELKKFINSLILYQAYSMNNYLHMPEGDNIKHTSFDKISVSNVYNLLSTYDHIPMTILGSTDIEYFDNVFTDKNKYDLYNIVQQYTIFNDLLSLVYTNMKNK